MKIISRIKAFFTCKSQKIVHLPVSGEESCIEPPEIAELRKKACES